MLRSDETLIRLATLSDADDIATIYNEGIDDRVATFESEHRTGSEIRLRLEKRGERFPTIVVVKNDRVLAWASAGPYRDRTCYSGIAEHSVYVRRDARGSGLGRLALESLVKTYRDLGFWKLLSRIFPENQASL